MKKKLTLIVLLIAFAVGIAGVWAYSAIYSSVTGFSGREKVLIIRSPLSADQLSELLLKDSIITHKADFLLTCRLKKFSGLAEPGRYVFTSGTSNNSIVNKLRIQAQSPVRIRFGQESSMQELAGTLGQKLWNDSVSFIRGFEDAVQEYGPEFTGNTFPCMFMPDTYEVYWNISPKAFVEKMHTVYTAFWTPERRSAAEALGFTPAEITILASIVKKETGKMEEAPKIAGLYLNRLRIGMKLESDPTSIFASGDTGVNRVRDQIGIESAYNTYHVKGLPPGPIAFTEGAFIDAVLHAEEHDFLFMCAKPERNGFHNFSRTLDQHLVYARAYWKALDAAGIE